MLMVWVSLKGGGTFLESLYIDSVSLTDLLTFYSSGGDSSLENVTTLPSK